MSNEKQNNIIELRNIGVTYKHFSGDEVRTQDGRIFNRNHDRTSQLLSKKAQHTNLNKWDAMLNGH